jgi:hypothetical protein
MVASLGTTCVDQPSLLLTVQKPCLDLHAVRKIVPSCPARCSETDICPDRENSKRPGLVLPWLALALSPGCMTGNPDPRAHAVER